MFWNRFIELCNTNNTTPTAVVTALSISGGSVTKWKNGSVPNSTTIHKLANYFDVSVDYLLGNTDQKEKPSSKDEGGEDAVIVCRNGQRIVRHFTKEQLNAIDNILDQIEKKEP